MENVVFWKYSDKEFYKKVCDDMEHHLHINY